MGTIIVTGSDGFIGGHLCKFLFNRSHIVIGLDIKSGRDILTCDLPDADRVFHLAAQTNARSTDVIGDAQTNIIASLRIFERYGKKVTFASSSAVLHPITPYAISKLACEHYASFYGAAAVRLCNIFGPGSRSVVDKFANESELTINGTGEQIRTYAHVDDAVRALYDTNVGLRILSGAEVTVSDLADLYPLKPRRYAERSRLDITDGRQ